MEYIKLGELVELKQGMAINAKSNHFVSKEETSLALLRIADMPTKSRVVFMSEDTPERFIASKDDIIYTRTGQVGLVFREQQGVVHNNCFRIIPNDENKLDKGYLYWYLSLNSIRNFANSIASGSAQPDLPHTTFKKIKIWFPEIDIQRKIASTLDQYELAIENNNKRIRLLAQMAENLYKEWFVRFRFPGYKDVEFDGTLPIGWQYQPISESMDFFDSQRVPLSSMQRDGMEKIYPYYGAAKLMDYVDDYLFDGEYLLLGEDGTVVTTDGFPVLQLVNDKFWVNNHAHVIRGKGNLSTRFLYLTFCRFPITGVVTGSAQPKISKGRLEKLKILVPDAITMEHFNNLINPMFDEINVLKKQVIRITKQRDMLLPRLMSGKLKV